MEVFNINCFNSTQWLDFTISNKNDSVQAKNNSDKQCGLAAVHGQHDMPPPASNLTFDRLTLKLVCESHLRWGTFIPNLGTLGLWVLELFAMYARDGQTERRTDGPKQRLLPLSLRSGA